jgi:hypothetical protein
MTCNIIIGCVLVVLSLSAIIALVIWSRRSINRIACEQHHSARDIVRERKNGR